MADALKEFYSGSMLAPNRVGNQLVQAQIYGGPESVSQMYAGTPYTPAAAPQSSGLASLYDSSGSGSPTGGAFTGGWGSDAFSAPASSQTPASGQTAVAAINDAAPNGNGYASGFTKDYNEQLPATGALAFAGGAAPSDPNTWSIPQLFAGLGINGNQAATGMDWQPAVTGAPSAAAVPGAEPWAEVRPITTPLAPKTGLVTGAAPKGNGSIAAMYGPPVTIATGKSVPVGTVSQGGAGPTGQPFTYQVQPDGSIRNTTTGAISASATGPVGVAKVAAQNYYKSALSGSMNKGHSNSAGAAIMG